MIISGALAAWVRSSLVARAIKLAGSGVLGVSVLSGVVDRCGQRTGEAVVHVAESGVEVTLDDRVYAIDERPLVPIVCELRVGAHELIVRRGDRTLRRESFTLRGGESVVLTAWDPARYRATGPGQGATPPNP